MLATLSRIPLFLLVRPAAGDITGGMRHHVTQTFSDRLNIKTEVLPGSFKFSSVSLFSVFTLFFTASPKKMLSLVVCHL